MTHANGHTADVIMVTPSYLLAIIATVKGLGSTLNGKFSSINTSLK